jgi:hypothetical protein
VTEPPNTIFVEAWRYMPEIPLEIDTSRPHPARMYDYYLGGKDNFAQTVQPRIRFSPSDNRFTGCRAR